MWNYCVQMESLGTREWFFSVFLMKIIIIIIIIYYNIIFVCLSLCWDAGILLEERGWWGGAFSVGGGPIMLQTLSLLGN